MGDFEKEHLAMIELHNMNATEIEKALFTKRYGLNKKHYELLSVQSVSILYSYWEGFIQKSFAMYIDYLNSLEIDLDNLCDSIFAYDLDSSFSQFRQYPERGPKRTQFLRNLHSHFLKNTLNLPRIVYTESNVKFSTLNRLMEQFSLEPFPEQWGTYKYPNMNLKECLNTFVNYRNGVAHGEDMSSKDKISQDIYCRYRKMVSDLMYEIHDRFMTAIQNKSYLKP